MPTRRPREPLLVLAAVAVAVTAVLIALGGRSGGARAGAEPTWRGLAGAQRVRVAVGQRVIVVLKAPALADRVGSVGGLATDEAGAPVDAGGALVAAAPDRAAAGSRCRRAARVQLHAHDQRILRGVRRTGDRPARARAGGGRDLPGARRISGLPLLDAILRLRPAARRVSRRRGRPRRHRRAPRHRGRSQPPVPARTRRAGASTSSGSDANATAAPNPDEPAQLEDHGTAMAGLVVGSGGPGELRGVAPGATVLPIRVAGWQRDALGALGGVRTHRPGARGTRARGRSERRR